MTENFIVYYKDEYNAYQWYEYATDSFKSDIVNKKNINFYYMFADYGLGLTESKNMTSEQINKYMQTRLKTYANDLVSWSTELKNCKSLTASIDYMKSYKYGDKTFYRSHHEMVLTFYKMYGGNATSKSQTPSKQIGTFHYAQINPIKYHEYKFFEACYNGGLTYLRENKKFYKNCYGYDFKMCYPELMSSKNFKIPCDEGQELILDSFDSVLDKKTRMIKFGLYRCDIDTVSPSVVWDEYNGQIFHMVFKYSPNKTYTHTDLNFLKVQFPEVGFRLIQDGLPNALTYNDFVTGEQMFGFWLKRIYDLKKEMPKNKLVKHLSSKMWGHLIEGNSSQLSDEQINEQKIKFGSGSDCTHIYLDEIVRKDGSVLNVISPKNKMYKHQIRIKPFLLSEARVKIAMVALREPEHVIRIQTDGIVFDKPFDARAFNNFVAEEKSTGSFYYHHVNHYIRVVNPDDQTEIDRMIQLCS